MKKLFLILTMVLAVSALLLAGCSSPSSPAPSKAAPAASAAAPAAQGAATKLVLSNWMPPPDITKFSGNIEAWARDFEKQTGNKYKVEVVHSGALLSIFDSYNGVSKGVADIAHFIPQDTDRPFPMMEVVALPWLQVRSDTATKALHKLWEKGYFDKELADVKILFLNTSASSDDLITIKEVKTLADLKGLKLATGGGSRVDFIKALGAVPVFAPPPEVYGMLQKGVVEGVMMSGYGLYPDHTAEFLRYLVNPIRLFRVTHVVAMNKAVYDKMPADVKKIVDTMDADAKYSAGGAKILADEYDATIAKFLKETGKEVTLNKEDTAVVEKISLDVFNKWIADKKAQGFPADAIVADYYNALKALGVEKPCLGYTPPAK